MANQGPPADAALDMSVLLGSAAWEAGGLQSSLPVLTSTVTSVTPLMQIYRPGDAAHFTQPQRPRWGLFAIVGVALLFVAAGGYELLRDDPSGEARPAIADASLRSGANQSAPAAALSTTPAAPAAARVPGDMSQVDEALRTAELVGRATPLEDIARSALLPALSPETAPPIVPVKPTALPRRAEGSGATGPGNGRRGKAAAHGGSRVASTRSPAEPVEVAPRQRDARGARAASEGSFGPCTSTVAALGLCTPASPSQHKE